MISREKVFVAEEKYKIILGESGYEIISQQNNEIPVNFIDKALDLEETINLYLLM